MLGEVKAIQYLNKFVGGLRQKSKQQHTWVAQIDFLTVQVDFFDSKKSGKVRVFLNTRIMKDVPERTSKDSYRFAFAYGDHELVISQKNEQTNLFIDGTEFENHYEKNKKEDRTTLPKMSEAASAAQLPRMSYNPPKQSQFFTQSPQISDVLLEVPNSSYSTAETPQNRTHFAGNDPFASYQTQMIKPNDKRLIVQAAFQREYSHAASNPRLDKRFPHQNFYTNFQ